MARVGIETRSAYKWVVLGLLALTVIVVNGGTLILEAKTLPASQATAEPSTHRRTRIPKQAASSKE